MLSLQRNTPQKPVFISALTFETIIEKIDVFKHKLELSISRPETEDSYRPLPDEYITSFCRYLRENLQTINLPAKEIGL